MTHQPCDSIMQQLRRAQQIERDELVRFKLRTTGEELDTALRLFQLSPSANNLAKVNGLFALAIRTLGTAGGSRHLTKYDPKAPLVPA